MSADDRAARVASAIERLSELSLLVPDAEADRVTENFLAFARDRLDEWHAAIEWLTPNETGVLSRDVVVVRTATQLADLVRDRQLKGRSKLALEVLVETRKIERYSSEVFSAMMRLKAGLRPVSLRSDRWILLIKYLPVEDCIPWIAHACLEVHWLMTQPEDSPSPWSPWLALWGRGVWPVPIGDGAMGLWIPTLDAGLEGLRADLNEMDAIETPDEPCVLLGLVVPRLDAQPRAPERFFFGYRQTGGFDNSPPPNTLPQPVGNLPARPVPYLPVRPVPNLPMAPNELPENLTAPVYGGPPIGADTADLSVLEKLRRWFRK